ncbi:MAG: thiamine phosphate synthase [bacterium]|nr:thiamine phosphate synthase [bacterium]
MNYNKIKGLYAIVDASFPDPVKIAGELMEGGAQIIQLRAKDLPAGKFLRLGREIMAETRKHGALFIINDRTDVAVLTGADGVHLGQDDMPIEEARKIMGEDKLIGISTHNKAEGLAAVKAGADYIGFGPIFKTGTKKDAGVAKGIEGLKALRREISIPIIGIGGVNKGNIKSVFDAGADAAAVISALAEASDIRLATCDIINVIGEANEC